MSFLRITNNNWLRNSSLLSLFIIFLNIVGQCQSKNYTSQLFNSTHRSFNSSSFPFSTNDSSYREARRSVVSGGLFSIITFANVACTGTSGEVGTCYSAKECNNLGGMANGKCAGNYGVCCTIYYMCGATVAVNNSYIVNPGYPSAATGPLSCSYTVQQLAGASELYLEFDSLDLHGPSLPLRASSGSCTNDSLTINTSGTGTTIPPLCGNLTGEDIYISWGSSTRRRRQAPTGLKTATIAFNLAAGDMQIWKIRVVQFKPTDACAAPAGCLQYFTDLSGTVDSFNYDNGNGQIVSTGTCIVQCFKLPTGYCSMLLTASMANSFMLPGTAPSTCQNDYLLVNGQKFCGDVLGANGMIRVNQTAGQNYLQIQHCTGTSNPDMDLGYSLQYTLQTC